MSDEVVDVGGREYTSAVKKELNAKIAKLEARIKELEKKPMGSTLTESNVKDFVWTYSIDRLYAELADPNSPVSNLVRELATGKR